MSGIEMEKERAQRWAVLIGINKYRHSDALPRLKCCVEDVKLLHETLGAPGGGFDPRNMVVMADDVDEPLRPTRMNIVATLASHLTKAGPEDTVLVSFSGHGMDVGGSSYILPSDVVPAAVAMTAIRVSDVFQLLLACRAKRKLLILDCCHSGAGDQATMINQTKAEGIAVLTACDIDQKACEMPEEGHGAFTWFFCKGLQGVADTNGDERLSLSEVYAFTRQQVSEWVSKLPGGQQEPKLFASDDMSANITLAYAKGRPTSLLGAGLRRKTGGSQPMSPLVITRKPEDTARVTIELSPQGAIVHVDDHPVASVDGGRTVSFEVAVGDHLISAEKKGFLATSRMVNNMKGDLKGRIKLAEMEEMDVIQSLPRPGRAEGEIIIGHVRGEVAGGWLRVIQMDSSTGKMKSRLINPRRIVKHERKAVPKPDQRSYIYLGTHVPPEGALIFDGEAFASAIAAPLAGRGALNMKAVQSRLARDYADVRTTGQMLVWRFPTQTRGMLSPTGSVAVLSRDKMTAPGVLMRLEKDLSTAVDRVKTVSTAIKKATYEIVYVASQHYAHKAGVVRRMQWSSPTDYEWTLYVPDTQVVGAFCVGWRKVNASYNCLVTQLREKKWWGLDYSRELGLESQDMAPSLTYGEHPLKVFSRGNKDGYVVIRIATAPTSGKFAIGGPGSEIVRTTVNRPIRDLLKELGNR